MSARLPLASLLAALVLGIALNVGAQAAPPAGLPVPPPASQNPSPMVEATRAHERLQPRELGGTLRTFPGPAGKAVEFWIPEGAQKRDAVDLVVHFQGAAWLAPQAVSKAGNHIVVAVLNLGSGSGVYDRSFVDPAVFDSLLASVAREISAVGADSQRDAAAGRRARRRAPAGPRVVGDRAVGSMNTRPTPIESPIPAITFHPVSRSVPESQLAHCERSPCAHPPPVA